MMDLQEQNDDSPRKKARLGRPRSCIECRRRRVRCLVLEPGQACQACRLHNTCCRPQDGHHERRRDKAQIHDEAAVLLHRMAEIERQVHILQAGSDIEDRSSSKSSSAQEPSNNFFLQLNPSLLHQKQGRGIRSYVKDDISSTSESQGSVSTPDYTNTSAPLMSFIGEALDVRAVNDGNANVSVGDNKLLQDLLRELQPLLPDVRGLHYILTETEAFWSIWPDFHFRLPQNELERPGVEALMQYITQSLESRDSLDNAKAILWLSICIQQLSPRWNRDTSAGPAQRLVKSYMRIANAILEINAEEGVHCVTGLECQLLQNKLFINQGKPQKAWLVIQKARSIACFQGLHRLSLAGASEIHLEFKETEHRRKVWEEITQADISLSLFLGLPTSSHDLPDIVEQQQHQFDTRIIMVRELYRIANTIVKRNQSNQFEDYSITLQLDQELTKCCAMMPDEWWDPSPLKIDDGAPIRSVYQMQKLKIFAGQVGKFIHLPFLVKARDDLRYLHSRNSVIKQSKRMINAYITLRTSNITELVMCDFMDFQAFSAALTIAVELLSSSMSHGVKKNTSEDSSQEEVELWAIVTKLSTTLQLTSMRLECTVASQGANVLDTLYSAYQHPEAASDFVADIPYFGKIRIVPKPAIQLQPTLPSSTNSSWDNEFHPNTSTPLFSADLFDPFSTMMDYFQQPSVDLTSDWTALVCDSNAQMAY